MSSYENKIVHHQKLVDKVDTDEDVMDGEDDSDNILLLGNHDLPNLESVMKSGSYHVIMICPLLLLILEKR